MRVHFNDMKKIEYYRFTCVGCSDRDLPMCGIMNSCTCFDRPRTLVRFGIVVVRVCCTVASYNTVEVRVLCYTMGNNAIEARYWPLYSTSVKN